MRAKLLLTAACTLGLLSLAQAQSPPTGGYLGKAVPDTLRILPPAPLEGSIRAEADRKVFLATRKLQDGDRWALARADDIGLMHALSCAIGVELSAQTTPKLVSMILRVQRDGGTITNLPKDASKRRRPFLIDKGPICLEDKRDSLSTSFDYPSGHTTASWAMGLLMAELAPDRATEILIRARAYGESRLVCGVHTMSAVDAGRTNGAVLVAALHGSKAFRDDLEAARGELAAARNAGPAPDAAACAAEMALAEKTPF